MSILDRNTDRALLVLRVAVALVFIAHGHSKLFESGHAGVTSFFTELGIPLPGVAAWCVALLEFGGGFALAVGAFTRVLASLLFISMLVAIGLAFAGAGAYSVDARLAARAS